MIHFLILITKIYFFSWYKMTTSDKIILEHKKQCLQKANSYKKV